MNSIRVDDARSATPQAPRRPARQIADGRRSGKEKWSKETYIALLAALAIVVHLIGRYGWHASARQYNWPLVLTLLIGGAPLLFDLFRRMARREFGSDLLAGLSIAASAVLGEYLAGSIVVLMLSGGTALEHYATRRASAVLSALAKRMPRIAHKLTDLEIADIGLDKVGLADRVVVFPHEICSVDGTVVEGRGTMDESYLTGEPFQIAKVPGAEVLSGAVNGETALTISVTKLPVDSRYAKIMQVMQEAEANRPRMRRIADRLGAWYTLLGLAVAVLGWSIGHDPKRFLAVLVIATPCPLLLAIPVAIIGAISVAASRGIIIKNPAMLERISSCRTVIFDKTGTLTYGKPSLTEILCAPGVPRQRVLQMAASLEQYSKHPLAGSVLEAGAERKRRSGAGIPNQREAWTGAKRPDRTDAGSDYRTQRRAQARRNRRFTTFARRRGHGMHPAARRGICGNLSFPRHAPEREQRLYRTPPTAPPGQKGNARVGRP